MGITTSCALLISLLITTSPAVATEFAQQPTWEIDDSWTYSRIAYATALTHRTEQSRFSLVVRVKMRDYYVLDYSTIDSDGKPIQAHQWWTTAINFVNRGGKEGKPQEFRWYKWPLLEGQSWETTWFHDTVGDGIWNAKVRAWETVTVPAGTFHAIRIELDNSCYYDNVDPGFCGQSDVVWYSPLVKRHVRLERRSWKGPYVGNNVLEELVAYSIR